MFFDQMFQKVISITKEKVGYRIVLIVLLELSIRIKVSYYNISIKYIFIDLRLSYLIPLKYIIISFLTRRYILRLFDQVLLIIKLRTLES